MRLIWTSFSATRLLLVLSMLGIGCVLAGIAAWLLLANVPFAFDSGAADLRIHPIVLGLPWLGFILLVCASALLPGILEQFLRGHLIRILPLGRLRILGSLVLSTLALALLIAIVATAAFIEFSTRPESVWVFWRTLLMAFIDIGLIYTAIWLVGKTSGVWRLAGMLWIVASILIPARYLGGIPPFSLIEIVGVVLWFAFGIVVLSAGHLQHAASQIGQAVTRTLASSPLASRYRTGDELRLLLGTDSPWVVSLGQVVPVMLVAVFVPHSLIWLVILTIFSALAGAITSQAAYRSRRLWLHFDWSRSEIARRIERAWWQYNVHSLAVLLLLYLGLAAWFEFPTAGLLPGCLLLVLCCSAFTYLGLMITSGLGALEAVLCVVTMLVLGVASLAVITLDLGLAWKLNALLAGLSITYRYMAIRRWTEIDWMRARSLIGN